MRPSDESANLDLLRAMAVLMVFASHIVQFVYPNLIGWIWDMGLFGVLIFFVHTSLVLMMSMGRSGGQPREFYIRRFFRIYPLCVLTVGVVVLFRIPPDPAAPFIPNGLGKVVSNLALTMNLTGSSAVLAPLWSLPLEIQMYVLLPVLFFLASKHKSAAFWMGLWASCVCLAWILQRFSSTHYVRVGYLMFGGLIPLSGVQPFVIGAIRFWQFVPCFLGGVIAYTLRNRLPAVLSWYVWPIFILVSYVLFEAFDTHHYGWISCLLLGCVIPLFRQVQQPLIRTMARAIAKYSYGIYLFHMIALWLTFTVLHTTRVIQYALCFVLTGASSFTAYHLLEHPLIRFGQQVAAGTRMRLEIKTSASLKSPGSPGHDRLTERLTVD